MNLWTYCELSLSLDSFYYLVPRYSHSNRGQDYISGPHISTQTLSPAIFKLAIFLHWVEPWRSLWHSSTGSSSWGANLFFSQWILCLKMGSGLETWQEILILDLFWLHRLSNSLAGCSSSLSLKASYSINHPCLWVRPLAAFVTLLLITVFALIWLLMIKHHLASIISGSYRFPFLWGKPSKPSVFWLKNVLTWP